ncbi:MAG TPA: hypothetical protein VGE08_16710 [Steroidobacter sp.]|uniref:hypothetical protein n=1 Tax=Steroidobacter sp. TaxID=1978227 RepID=UPI002ED83CFB
MGLSETILAAMIGALATVTTALFQLFSTFKEQRSSKADVRPKKRSTLRSVLAVLALMVASGAGGFLYSEFIKERAAEEMRVMRTELKELRSLIASEREAARAEAADTAGAADESYIPMTLPVAMEGVADSVESVVYVPACRAGGATGSCGEQDAQRIALCGTIPAYARIDGIQLFAQPNAMQAPWDQHRASFEQDLGGARFTGSSFEYAQGTDLKAVCVNFMQWSSEHPHIARIVVRYGFGNAPAMHEQAMPASGPPAQISPLPPVPSSPAPLAETPAVIAADSLPALPTAAALAGPATPQ